MIHTQYKGSYGIMPERDYRTFDKTLDLLCDQFPNVQLYTLEIGVHRGMTSRGINLYLAQKHRTHIHTGIDNQRDLPINRPFSECQLILGNSSVVYNKVPNNSQHLIFIDGCHNYPNTIIDFLLYQDKVKENGFIMFHDCGEQIKDFTDYQGEGDRSDPDMFIRCRKAVMNLGLLDGRRTGFKLLIDEYDPLYHTGGIVVIQKKSFEIGKPCLYLGGEIPVDILFTEHDAKAIENGAGHLYAHFKKEIL